jgi:hypothetical protein
MYLRPTPGGVDHAERGMVELVFLSLASQKGLGAHHRQPMPLAQMANTHRNLTCD